MADLTQSSLILTSLIGAGNLLLGALITAFVQPLSEALKHGALIREEKRKTAESKKDQRETKLRDLFNQFEEYANETWEFLDMNYRRMRGWNAELPGEMEKRHEKNRKYSFTLIQAALLIDFSNLTLLWNEFIGARDQAVDYLEEKVKWGTALTPDMITGFVGLQYKYENAAREVKEGIAYLINVEKPDKLSPLLQPHQDP